MVWGSGAGAPRPAPGRWPGGGAPNGPRTKAAAGLSRAGRWAPSLVTGGRAARKAAFRRLEERPASPRRRNEEAAPRARGADKAPSEREPRSHSRRPARAGPPEAPVPACSLRAAAGPPRPAPNEWPSAARQDGASAARPLSAAARAAGLRGRRPGAPPGVPLDPRAVGSAEDSTRGSLSHRTLKTLFFALRVAI